MREFCPHPTRHISLCEALDRLLNTGVVALGELTLSVAGVDLVYLGLQLVLTSVESGRPGAPASAGSNTRPQLVPNSRGGPPPMPPEQYPAGQTVKRPPSAAQPPPLAGHSGSLSSAALGEESQPIANALADSNRAKNGLGKLVLTLMKLLHELLERQALRRIEGGGITPAQVEQLGLTLMNQAREIERLRRDFGLPEEDLNLDLGPLGKLL
jgi:hypothetical protein